MTDKRKVICIIAVLCVVFFSLLCAILVKNSGGGNTACIYSDGKLIKTIDLRNAGDQTFTVYSEDSGYNVIEDSGYNVITVKDGSISVTDADCPDRICVMTAPISDGIQPIVCMPHKLVIRIETNRTEYSHDS